MSAEWEDIDESEGIAGPWPERADPMVLWQQWRTPAIDSGLPPRRLLRLHRNLKDSERADLRDALANLGWVPVWPDWGTLDYLCVEASADKQEHAPSLVLIRVAGVFDEAAASNILQQPGNDA